MPSNCTPPEPHARAVFTDELENRGVYVVAPKVVDGRDDIIVVDKDGHGKIALTVEDWEKVNLLVRSMASVARRARERKDRDE